MRLLQLTLGILSTVLFFSDCTSSLESNNPLLAKQVFVHEVYPVLERKCMSCHGHNAAEVEGGLQVIDRASLLKGGQSGKAAVIPGEPQESPLIHLVEGRDPTSIMPPKRDEQLTTEEIQWLRNWISAGAIWLDEQERAEILAMGDWNFGDRIQVQTSGGQSESWDQRRYSRNKLWAFYPLTSPTPPKNKYEHPIDAFLHDQLRKAGLGFAKKADPLTLLKRASLGLTGLPPNQKGWEKFISNKDERAYVALIERLLESPHYGEHWGKHWLDVVRYADSDGYSNDFIRPNAWRYRDYVIRSFNQDKPYDQFVQEQLAGDELDPDNPELLFLDDVTNIVGETFLSLPLGCAKCHDHKYDPIPTKDYYRIQAVFAPTQFASRQAAFLPVENLDGLAEEQERIAAWIKKTQEETDGIRAKEEEGAKKWFKDRGRPYLDKRTRRKLPDGQQPPRYVGLTFEDLGYRKVLDKRRQTLHKSKLRFQPYAYSVYNGPNRVVRSNRNTFMPEAVEGKVPATFVLNGGSVYAPLEEVPAGVLSVISAMAEPLDGVPTKKSITPIPQSLDGRRLGFAKWLTGEASPLVVRSIVNRVWQYHFGKGLVETSNNFGGTGTLPSHPELLDWLSQYFIEQKWSIKALHRLIMTSQAYQQASQAQNRELMAKVDPDNKLLSHFTPRRLTAEEIRDAMLMASGEIKLEVGGIPIRPEINQEIALQPRHTMGSIAMAYQPSPRQSSRNRRTIYAEKIRNLPDPFLRVFNQPATEVSCERRNSSTVTPQVFTLLNSPQLRDRAIALALRLEQEGGDELQNQIQLAAQLCWNRNMDTKELHEAANYVREMEIYHQSNPAPTKEYPTTVTRKMFEEMTGESFEYVGELDVFRGYEADTKDSDVRPTTRALADLAMVLFNTNEFLYVF